MRLIRIVVMGALFCVSMTSGSLLGAEDRSVGDEKKDKTVLVTHDEPADTRACSSKDERTSKQFSDTSSNATWNNWGCDGAPRGC